MKINKIIIHCAATPEGRDISVETIRRWHTKPVSQGGRGWKDIGYHYVIYLDGSIHAGRREGTVGAHTKGQNSCSIGICYVGGLAKDAKTPKDTRTAPQKKALKELISSLRAKYGKIPVYGHRDFARKACPCFDAYGEYN